MLSRTSKRIFIGGVYVLIVTLVVGGYYWTRNYPTCFDSIKNGQEEGVDCGTVACGKACAPSIQNLVVQNVQLMKTPDGTSDVAIQVYNPNIGYGVISGTYDLVIKDSSGAEINRLVGNNFYMLPGQTKYLVLTALKDVPLGQESVEIKSVEWEKVSSVPDVSFVITREAVTPGNNTTTYQAVITNNSNYDFDTIDVSMVVTDGSVIIATNTTNFQTFLSQTDRSVKVTWPFVLPAGARIKTEVNTNVFNNANFIKRNGTQEKFQQYY